MNLRPSVTVQVEADTARAVAQVAAAGKAMQKSLDGVNTSFSGKKFSRFKRELSKWSAIVAAFAETVTVALYGATGAITALASSLGFALSASAALLPIGVGLGAAFVSLIVGSAGLGSALSEVNKEFALAREEGRDFNIEAEGIQKALDELGTSAGDLVVWFAGIRGELADIQTLVSDKLFDGLADDLQSLQEGGWIDDLGTGLGLMADELNRFFRAGIEGLQEVDLIELFEGLAPIVGNVFDAFNELAEAFTDFVVAALPAAERLSEMFAGWASGFSDFIEATAGSGELQTFLDNAIDSFQEWADLIGAAGGALSTLFQAGRESGDGLVGNLTDLINEWDTWMKSVEGQTALSDFFSSSIEIVKALQPVLVGAKDALDVLVTEETIGNFTRLAETVGELLPVLAEVLAIIGEAELLSTLGEALIAVGEALPLEVLSEFASLVGEELRDLIVELTPTLDAMGESLGELLEAFAPLIPVLGEILAAVGELAGEALGLVADLFIELFETLKENGSLEGIVTSFQLLAEAGGMLLEALGPTLITTIAILADVFLRFTQLINPLLEVIISLEGPLQLFGEALNWIADIAGKGLILIIDTLLAALNGLGNALSFVFSGKLITTIKEFGGSIADAFSDAKEAVTGWFSSLGEDFSKAREIIASFASGAINSFTEKISGAFQAMADKIKSIITWLVETLVNTFRLMRDIIVSFSEFVVGVFNYVFEAITGIMVAVGEFLAPFAAAVTEFFAPVVEWLTNLFSNLWNALTALYEEFLGQFVSDIGEMVEAVVGWVASMPERLLENIQQLMEMFSGFGEWLSNLFSNLWQALVNLYEEFLGQFVEDIKSFISSALGLFQRFVDGVREWWQRIKQTLTDAWNGIKKLFTEDIPSAIKSGWEGFTEFLSNLIQWVPDMLNQAKEFYTGISEEFKKIPETIRTAMSGVYELIVAPFRRAKEAVSNLIGGIRDAASSIPVVGGLLPFATGGIVMGPTRALIGEAGPEAVIPLSKPLSQVDPSVRAMAALLRGAGTIPAGNSVVSAGPQTSQVNNFTINEASSGEATAHKVVNRLAAQMR